MPSNEYHITRFSSGLRLVVWPLQGRVSYIGAVINAGSRDEGDDRQGLAHFVEHTIFKGTGSRSSLEISSCMEEVGGELNAYTSKDETAIYTNAPAGHADRAISLIADLVSDSRFPEAELAKEREVVVEEINSYLDSPADSVFDEFDERIFEGCGLAHNILGTPESVRMLTGADCRDFIDTFYAPSNMTVYAAGPDDPERIAPSWRMPSLSSTARLPSSPTTLRPTWSLSPRWKTTTTTRPTPWWAYPSSGATTRGAPRC